MTENIDFIDRQIDLIVFFFLIFNPNNGNQNNK